MTTRNREKEIADLIRHITERWEGADKNILRQAFPLLAKGQPVPVAELALTTGASLSVVELALERGRAGRDRQGRLTELFGFTLNPTWHRVETDGVVFFTCCALTSHILPRLIDRVVKVESVDPVSRHLVRLTIAPDGLHSVEPVGAVATLVKTEKREIENDVRSSLCSQVYHFTSTESAKCFSEEEGKRFVVEIEQFHEVGQRLYAQIWAQSPADERPSYS